MKKHYTTTEAARRLDLSVQTVQGLVDAGRLPAEKTAGGHRRIDARAVEAIVASRPGGYSVSDPQSIVVIDRLPGTSRAIEEALAGRVPNARIRAFDDPVAAMISIGAQAPGLMILDHHLPGFDALAMIRAVQAAPTTARVRVILTTSVAPTKLLPFRGLPEGVTVLAWPLTPPRIRAAVDRAMAQPSA